MDRDLSPSRVELSPIEGYVASHGAHIAGKRPAETAPFQRPFEETGVEDGIVVLVVERKDGVLAAGSDLKV